MRSDSQMTPLPPQNTEPAFVYLGKLAVAWILTGYGYVAEKLGSVQSESVATWLAIVYTTLMIITHVRKEYLKRRFADTQPAKDSR